MSYRTRSSRVKGGQYRTRTIRVNLPGGARGGGLYGYSCGAGGAGVDGLGGPINALVFGKASHTRADTTAKPDEERPHWHPLAGPVHRRLPHPPDGRGLSRVRLPPPGRQRRRLDQGRVQRLLAVGGGEG